MRILLFLLTIILFIGCSNPYKKILTDQNLDPEERVLAAKFCYIHFKPEESVHVGIADSTDYKKYLSELSGEYNQLSKDYEDLINYADSANLEIGDLEKIISSFRSRLDSLNGIIKALQKGIPCPKQVDTIRLNNPAEIEVLNTQIRSFKSAIYAAQVEIDKLNINNKELSTENDQLTKDKNKGWTYFYIAIGIFILIVAAYIYLKIKSIIKF